MKTKFLIISFAIINAFGCYPDKCPPTPCIHIVHNVDYCDTDSDGILTRQELDTYQGRADTFNITLPRCDIASERRIMEKNNTGLIVRYLELGDSIRAAFHQAWPMELVCK